MDSTTGKLDFHHSYSHSFSGLQFADFLAWSVFQKEERNNSDYVNLFGFESEFHDFPIRNETLFKSSVKNYRTNGNSSACTSRYTVPLVLPV